MWIFGIVFGVLLGIGVNLFRLFLKIFGVNLPIKYRLAVFIFLSTYIIIASQYVNPFNTGFTTGSGESFLGKIIYDILYLDYKKEINIGIIRVTPINIDMYITLLAVVYCIQI